MSKSGGWDITPRLSWLAAVTCSRHRSPDVVMPSVLKNDVFAICFSRR
jgi:hypothetical protein